MNRKGIFSSLIAGAAFGVSLPVWALVGSGADSWRLADPSKIDREVPREEAIERRRVIIKQKTYLRSAPSLSLEELEFESARRLRVEEKTEELIQQIETLLRRPGQNARVGELKMRLADLYFGRAQAMAARESELWAQELKQWEAKKDGQAARPILRTPQADRYRQESLGLYESLEKESRLGDHGAARMIQRDEVLYFYSSTLIELNRGRQAQPFLQELVDRYAQSSRAYGSRVMLADLYFEQNNFSAAIPQLLRVAAGEGAPKGAEQDVARLRAYSLYKLGWCYLNSSQYPKAVLAFQRTLEATKQNKANQGITFDREAVNDLARAFALAGQYSEGEAWFESSGYGNPENIEAFRRQVIDVARDRGQYKTALEFIDKALSVAPRASGARALAFDRVQILLKTGDLKSYAQALQSFARDYGEGSAWLNAQESTPEDKRLLIEESLSLLRREAKDRHRNGQRTGKSERYEEALLFYKAYFGVVPQPNTDTPQNLHEMRFYFAELLYKRGRYGEAARAYAAVGEGKYSQEAGYSRILALREGVQSEKSLSKDLANATETFIEQNPKDERVGEMLYATAYESFQAGAMDEALITLKKVQTQFPGDPKGVEATERILFIYDKKGDVNAALNEVQGALANPALIAAGGPEFRKKLETVRSQGLFEKASRLPDSTLDEKLAKARAFNDIAKPGLLPPQVREKALNNAFVYAKQAGQSPLASESAELLLKDFPESAFAKDLYLDRADSALSRGKWNEALGHYAAYLKIHTSTRDAASQAAAWNRIYVQSRLEGYTTPEFEPKREFSAGLLAEMRGFLKSYPQAATREELLSMMAYRKGVEPREIQEWQRLPQLTEAERTLLEEASVVLRVRSREIKSYPDILKNHPLAKTKGAAAREALARAAFAIIEPSFTAYERQGLDYKPARFAKSLERKTAEIEKLEREYMGVVAYGNGEFALRSVERLARLYLKLSSDIGSFKGSPEEKAVLDPFVKSFSEKSDGFLKTCLVKATEFKMTGAGVETCRSSAQARGVYVDPLSYESIPKPQWTGQAPEGGRRALLQVATESLGRANYGEFYLAGGLLEKEKTPLSPEESAELNNLSGIASVRLEENQAAVRIFRQVADRDGAALAGIRTAAMKNLSALYLSVRDYGQALEILSTLSERDADVSFMKGLALRGLGRNAEAAQAYALAAAVIPKDLNVVFHQALAFGAAGDFVSAASLMNRYVETEQPTGSHISRQLLREWKAKVK